MIVCDCSKVVNACWVYIRRGEKEKEKEKEKERERKRKKKERERRKKPLLGRDKKNNKYIPVRIWSYGLPSSRKSINFIVRSSATTRMSLSKQPYKISSRKLGSSSAICNMGINHNVYQNTRRRKGAR